MADQTQTGNLALPYIMPSQAMKHITHNMALQRLDALVQLAVLDRTLTAPPGTPAEGDRHIVAAGATGEWAGRDGDVALWQDGRWDFATPRAGWRAWSAAEGRLIAFDGAGWQNAGANINPADLVGVNATATADTRLAVKSDTALFTADDVTPGTGDMRITVNKTASANTASLLLQDGYAGHAEIGLTGDDRLHIKTSPDGSTWQDTVVIDPATNSVGIGTSTPAAPLHVAVSGAVAAVLQADADGGSSGSLWRVYAGGNAGAAAFMSARKARGSTAAPSAALAGDTLMTFGGNGYATTGFPSTNKVSIDFLAAENQTDTAGGSQIALSTTANGSTARMQRILIGHDGTVRPAADNAYALGASGFRWASVWAANGTIQTSDARDKEVVGNLAFAGAMIDAVDPVLFKWKIGGNLVRPSASETAVDEMGNFVPVPESVPRAGERTHAGFLAQDLKAAMDLSGVEFGAWGLDDKSNPESQQWTRPDQLVAVLWAALKETRAEVAALRVKS